MEGERKEYVRIRALKKLSIDDSIALALRPFFFPLAQRVIAMRPSQLTRSGLRAKLQAKLRDPCLRYVDGSDGAMENSTIEQMPLLSRDNVGTKPGNITVSFPLHEISISRTLLNEWALR